MTNKTVCILVVMCLSALFADDHVLKEFAADLQRVRQRGADYRHSFDEIKQLFPQASITLNWSFVEVDLRLTSLTNLHYSFVTNNLQVPRSVRVWDTQTNGFRILYHQTGIVRHYEEGRNGTVDGLIVSFHTNAMPRTLLVARDNHFIGKGYAFDEKGRLLETKEFQSPKPIIFFRPPDKTTTRPLGSEKQPFR